MDIFELLGEQPINNQSDTNGNFPTQFQTFDSADSATLAPLPQSLQEPQRGYPDTTSMVEFIGEAPLNTQMSSWNALPYAPNQNLNQIQINGMLVEPRVSNPLTTPNIIENNNYNGINHQFPYPPPSQPNLVGAMPGIATGQSSGQFFTNQISDLSLRDSIINSQPTWNSRLPQTQSQTFPTLLPQCQTFSSMLPQSQTQLVFSTMLPHQSQSQALSTLLPQTQAFPTMLHQTNYTSENPLTIFDLQSQNSIQHPVNLNSRLESYPYLQHTSAPVLTNPNGHHDGYGSMLQLAPAAPSALPNPLYSNIGVQASVFGTGSSSFSSVVSPAIPSYEWLRDDPTVNSYSQASLPNNSFRFSQPNRYQQAMMPLGHGQRDVTSVQQLLRSESMPKPNNERRNIPQNSESQNATFRGSFSVPSSDSHTQNLQGTTELTEVEQLIRLVRATDEKKQQQVAASQTKGLQDKGKSPATSSKRRVKETQKTQQQVPPTPKGVQDKGKSDQSQQQQVPPTPKGVQEKGKSPAASSKTKKPAEIQKILNMGSSRKIIRTNSADGRANKMRKVLSEPYKNGTMSREEQTSPKNVEKEDHNILPTIAPMSSGVYLQNADGVHPDLFVRAMIAQEKEKENEKEEVTTVQHSQEKLN